jgi:D-alanine-D-alanine ligase
MKIVLLHDAIGEGSAPDERDVAAQMEAVEGALDELGHAHWRLPLSLDLEAGAAGLRALGPDLVFNLVESLVGHGRLIHLAPYLLDALGIPYSGCRADAVHATSNKLTGKRLMRGGGIPTPVSYTLGELRRGVEVIPGRYILKSVWEHASRGLDESSLVRAGTAAVLRESLEARLGLLGGEGFAEQYVEGREFNLSLLDGAVLPHAEIVFEGYEASKPRLVGYRAKWDEGSFEYHHTPRRFEFPSEDRPLLTRLDAAALDCWKLFGLRGYARVDFRVDERGRPWVLEVNTNPCLSADAGFAAAVARGGLSFSEAVRRILAASAP